MTALMYKVYENQEPHPSGPLYYLFRSLVVTFFFLFFLTLSKSHLKHFKLYMSPDSDLK